MFDPGGYGELITGLVSLATLIGTVRIHTKQKTMNNQVESPNGTTTGQTIYNIQHEVRKIGKAVERANRNALEAKSEVKEIRKDVMTFAVSMGLSGMGPVEDRQNERGSRRTP